MYQRKFIDRKDELNFLQSRYTTGSPEFIVIYGRRRVGKTELILKFMENKKGIYYLASKEGDRSNIKDFSYRISRMIGDDNFKKIEFPDWITIFESLFGHKWFIKQANKQ